MIEFFFLPLLFVLFPILLNSPHDPVVNHRDVTSVRNNKNTNMETPKNIKHAERILTARKMSDANWLYVAAIDMHTFADTILYQT